MNIAVRFQYSPDARRPASAWLVEGANTDAWLAELTGWRTPLAAARLFLVPTSSIDATPLGVLVMGVAVASKPGAGSSVSPRTRPYGLVHGRLYLPIEAAWDPRISGAELESLLDDDKFNGDAIYVWHPRAGLVCFAPESALRVSALLAAPPPVPERWDLAVPGTAISARLISLEPESVPTAQQVLEDGRGDIAIQRPDADRMPPSPNEAKEGMLGTLGRAAEKGIAGSLLWLANQAPQTATSPSWINALQDWANSKLQGISRSLEASRNRELHRLMNLLTNDPDEGLRFALPMGGGENRGIALPSNQLGRRNVDFRLNGLGGGGPTDTWDLSFQMRQTLTQRYRELAAREIQLGRHRRAAYIFATLLNDVQTAAVTLEDGRHWREAAALYEEKLDRPLEAARCLRQGGLRTEAIALYDRLGQHETVGDLYAELDQADEAEAAWRQAVKASLAAADVLGAARLLELKLGNVDEAYDRLTAAWPYTKQATLCLTEAFTLLARAERHEQAAALVAQLPQLRPTPASAPTLVEVLGAQARSYPADPVRSQAADQARVVASTRLIAPTISSEEARRLTRVVGDLVPTDRLLARDGQRFLLQRRKQVSVADPVVRKQAIPMARELRLPPGIEWRAATATNDTIFAAGFRGLELVVVRTDWKGAEPEEPLGRKWTVEPGEVDRLIALSADPFDEEQVVVHVCGNKPLETIRFFQQNDRFPRAVGVGSHRGLSERAYGVSYSDRRTFHIAHDGGESLLVDLHALENKALIGSVGLDLLKLPGRVEDCRLPLPLSSNDKGTYLGVGTNLCRIHSVSKADIIQTASPITQIIGSAKGTRPRLAVAMEQGGMMFWDDELHHSATPFASEMAEPRIALTRDGSLVVASFGEIEVYSTHDRQLKLTGRTTLSGFPILAALATRQSNQFALLSTDGHLRYFNLPN